MPASPRYGVQKTTIEDVAKKAGVARATLYKYVPGGRDELVLAVIVREAERNIDTVLEAMQAGRDLEDSFTAGILAAVDRIQADEHLLYLFSPEILGTASRAAWRRPDLGRGHGPRCCIRSSKPDGLRT